MYLTSSLLDGFCMAHPTFPNKANGHKRLEVIQSGCRKPAFTRLFTWTQKNLGKGEELLTLQGEGGTQHIHAWSTSPDLVNLHFQSSKQLPHKSCQAVTNTFTLRNKYFKVKLKQCLRKNISFSQWRKRYLIALHGSLSQRPCLT